VIRQDTGREQAGQTSTDDNGVVSCAGKIAVSHRTLLCKPPTSTDERKHQGIAKSLRDPC